jgi:prepilin peptidase CpaA
MMSPIYIAALTIAAVACVTDLRTRRIPNWLTFGTSAAAFLFHVLSGGWASLASSVGGWLVGVAVFAPFFVLRGLGAGDVKLLAALGAWLGPLTILYVAFYSTLAGGVLAVVVAVKAGYLRTAFRNLGGLLALWWTTGVKPVDGLTLNSGTAPKLAYAVPIFAGLMVTLWMR